MKSLLLFFSITGVCCACFWSCRNQDSKDSLHEGDYISVPDPVVVSIEELIEDYDTIRLEVTNESLIRNVECLFSLNDRWYIKDGDKVFIFASDGRFMSKIDNRGGGPGEYVHITNLSMDYARRKVVITDMFSQKILIYNADGMFERSLQLNFNPIFMVPFHNGYLHFRSGRENVNALNMNKKMAKYNVHFMDSTGHVTACEVLDATPLPVDVYSMMDVTYSNNEKIVYQPVLSDTVYEITQSETRPLYVFDNKSSFKMLTPSERRSFSYQVGNEVNTLKEKEEQGYLLSLGWILNSDNYFYCKLGSWNQYLHLFYSKQEKRSMMIDYRKITGNDFYKDFFFKNCCPVGMNGDYFCISKYFPPDLDLQAINSLPDGKLKTYLKETNLEEANPILVVYKIKFPEK
jgi:hypothetical protein